MPRSRFGKLPEEKRRRILLAAEGEFVANGFKGASYNQIIEKSGVSKGAMYYYFDDKMDLFTTVMLAESAKVVSFWEEAIADELLAQDFWGGLEQVVRRQARFALEHPELIALGRCLLELEMDPELAGAGPLAELQAQSKAWIGRIVVIGQESGQVRSDLPLDLLVSLLQALGETFDRYYAGHMEEIVGEDPATLASLTVDTFRRVAQPHAEERIR
jgi:AcrR family transcriptional regulator